MGDGPQQFRGDAAGRPVCGLATPPGRAAVATIVFRGPAAVLDTEPRLFRAMNGRAADEQPLNRIVFGHWGRSTPEDIVLCRTAPQDLEIHCHGGDQAAGRILTDLVERGAQRLSRDGLLELLQPGLDAALTTTLHRAATTRTADYVLAQFHGQFARELAQLRTLAADRADGRVDSQVLMTLQQRLERLLHWSEFGRHLTEPWQVVLAGRTNVGKSSLINAILGFSRSIVFDEPGTTRDVVSADTAVQGWPISLSDTAGLRANPQHLEAAGIARTLELMQRADCRILVVDAAVPLLEEDRALLQAWPDAIVVANKCDLLPESAGLDAALSRALRVSARTGAGLAELLERIADMLVPEVPPLDEAMPVCLSHLRGLEQARDALRAHPPDVAACRSALESLLTQTSPNTQFERQL